MSNLLRRLLVMSIFMACIIHQGNAVQVLTRENYDICIYGGTSAGIVAAYSAAQMGRTVVIVEPGKHLGGLTTGGLGFTDIGNKQVVKGVAKQFYRKLGAHYGRLEQWVFEPHVADSIMKSYMDHDLITVKTRAHLNGTQSSGKTIRSINVSSGGRNFDISARYFIDATYEGDLLASAGVSFTVGRESNKTYGETFNGVQMLDRHQFPDGVDPYKIKGDLSSGLLWGISSASLAPKGSGDKMIQAYNYRICLTSDPENMIPITEPDNYDPERYQLLIRLIEAQPEKMKLGDYFIWNRMPNNKTDINNKGGFSTDMIGMNHTYPQANYSERQRIIREHTDYTKGLLYFVGNDPRVPETLRSEMRKWGYPKDEYIDNDHWTPQLYVREGRRLIGDYVATQADCQSRRVVEDGIALAAYVMDSHNCQRIVVHKDGIAMVKNEGNVEVPLGKGPFPISYRSIVAKRAECGNLLVPVCLSSSHIAFGSIRMEPVFMVLGQAAAIASCLAIENNVGAIQDIDYREINKIIDDNPYLDGSVPDIIIDDADASVQFSGEWKRSGGGGFGKTCRDLMAADKTAKATYPFRISKGGTYSVYSFQHLSNTKLDPITDFVISDGAKRHRVTLDTRGEKPLGQARGEWMLLGEYSFGDGDQGYVEIMRNRSSNAPLRADAILLVRQTK